MNDALQTPRQAKVISSVLDILCGRSFDDDEHERIFALISVAAVTSVLVLTFIWRKEIVFSLIEIFRHVSQYMGGI